VYLLPIYAKDILHVGEFGLGLLRAAPAVGALAMGTLLAHLPPMKRAGSTMLWAVVGFGIATIIFGMSHIFWLSMLMLFLTGVFDNISVIVRHSLVLILTPDEMRGRVSAVNNIFIGSSNEIGGYESGLVAQRFSPVASVVSGGIGTLVIIAIWAYIFPVLRNFGALSGAVELKAEEEITKENP
ncbi:MAG: MFS transporter, partial [bacterium]